MEKHLLEFWGNFLINAAREKKKSDDFSQWLQNLTSWMQEGFATFSDLMEILGGFPGAGKFPSTEGEYPKDFSKVAEKTSRDFQKSFKEYQNMMGMFFQKDHISLVDKYEKLKKKCEEQEETIKHLQLLLKAKEMDQSETLKGMQNIMKSQSEAFGKMMTSFMNVPESETSDDSRTRQTTQTPPKEKETPASEEGQS